MAHYIRDAETLMTQSGCQCHTVHKAIGYLIWQVQLEKGN